MPIQDPLPGAIGSGSGKLLLSGYPGPGVHHSSIIIQKKGYSIEEIYFKSIFAAGIRVFIGLHSEEECLKHEELNNLLPLKDSMLDKLKDVDNGMVAERGLALDSLELLLQQRKVNISNDDDNDSTTTQQSALECTWNLAGRRLNYDYQKCISCSLTIHPVRC